MKAQNYQIKRDNYTIVTLIAAFFLAFFSMFLDSEGIRFGEITGSIYISRFAGDKYLFVVVAGLILSTRISGWDYNDKTINYELLSGHSRMESYGARAILSLIWSMLAYIVIMVIPSIFFTVINGWGNSIALKNVVIRYLLMIFPIFRIVCLITFLTFVVSNCYKALVAGFVLFGAVNLMIIVIEEMYDKKITIQFAMTNMAELVTFPYYKNEFINGENVMVFESALKGTVIGNTVLVSLVVGCIAIFTGYLYFKKRDMD